MTPPLAPINGMFRQPTDVTWNAQGDIFISDGYINSRVAKYDKNGDWVKSFGEPGNGPGQFNTPHGIASGCERQHLRRRPRQRRAFRCSTATAQFLRQIKINVPVPADAQPVIGNRRIRTPGHGNAAVRARRGRSASRPARIRSCTRRMRFRVASTR